MSKNMGPPNNEIGGQIIFQYKKQIKLCIYSLNIFDGNNGEVEELYVYTKFWGTQYCDEIML